LSSDKVTEYGRLAPPFPVERCANVGCSHGDAGGELEEHGAYLYRDLDTGKLVVLCGDCGRHAELVAPHRFAVVPL
jgi:hypothetical protein